MSNKLSVMNDQNQVNKAVSLSMPQNVEVSDEKYHVRLFLEEFGSIRQKLEHLQNLSRSVYSFFLYLTFKVQIARVQE